MLDFANLEQYRENNRIEAKKALGGLPHSIWETYSAFANTLGGLILLGVEEAADHSLHTVHLPDPQKLVQEFWNLVNNQTKASVNILTDRHIQIRQVGADAIVVISVPRAQRFDRPVYIDGNPLTGTYRRNGEGDYRCTKEEVQAMLRDAAVQTPDRKVLDKMEWSVLDTESIRRYRTRMKNLRPGHVWEDLEDEEFLYKLGAVGRGEDGTIHPTAAGLLMFGDEYEIVREFPNYFLDYREQMDETARWTDRIVSSSGEWSGNVYDFYFRVYNRIAQDIRTPFRVQDGSRVDDTPIHTALREALANCLVNADYYGRQGLVVVKKRDEITFSNPGGFRIELETAKSGGISDPRNATLIKMFNLVNIGERAGSGIPSIFAAWQKQGWPSPQIEESFEPERITLRLTIPQGGTAEKEPINTDDNDPKETTTGDDNATVTKRADKHETIKAAAQKQLIIEYLTDHVNGKTADLAQLLGVKSTRVKKLLAELTADGIVVPEGANRNRVYRLKS